MAISLCLGWPQITFALWAQVFLNHPKLSDIAKQITRLTQFCYRHYFWISTHTWPEIDKQTVYRLTAHVMWHLRVDCKRSHNYSVCSWRHSIKIALTGTLWLTLYYSMTTRWLRLYYLILIICASQSIGNVPYAKNKHVTKVKMKIKRT